MTYMPSTTSPGSGPDPAGQRYMDAQATKAKAEAKNAEAEAEKRKAEASRAEAEAEKHRAETAAKQAAQAEKEAARLAEQQRQLTQEFVEMKQEFTAAKTVDEQRLVLKNMAVHTDTSKKFVLETIYRGNLEPKLRLELLSDLYTHSFGYESHVMRMLPNAITDHTEHLNAFQKSETNPGSTALKEFQERVDKLFQDNAVHPKASKNATAHKKLFEGLNGVLSELDISPKLRYQEKSKIAGQALQHLVDRDVRWFDITHDVTIRTFWSRYDGRKAFNEVVKKLLQHI